MTALSGKISDRLRATFKDGDKAYTPIRPADVKAKRGPIPDGVEGHQLGGRKKGRVSCLRLIAGDPAPDLWAA